MTDRGDRTTALARAEARLAEVDEERVRLRAEIEALRRAARAVGQDSVDQVRRGVVSPAPEARRAESQGLAREAEHHLLATGPQTSLKKPRAATPQSGSGIWGSFAAISRRGAAEGALPDVMWGSHDAVDHRLGGLAESRALNEWFDTDLGFGEESASDCR